MHRTKEFRRYQLQKKKDRFRKISQTLYFGPQGITEDELTKWVGLKAASPKATQCQCCCSPRYSSWYTKEEKLTMQERRAKQEAEFEVSEVALYGNQILGT